jgi:hypothetical protein
MRISAVVLIQCFPECDPGTGGGLLEGLDERIDINLSGNGLYCFLTSCITPVARSGALFWVPSDVGV